MSERRRLVADAPIDFDDAALLVRQAVAPFDPAPIPLAQAQGLVLAEGVVASHPVPPFASSMVDGFAIRAADVAGASPETPVELAVVSEIMAGDRGEREIGPGEAGRIMTGAPLPPGVDAVVMLEDTSWTPGRVRVEREVAPGKALRSVGEDLAAGDLVVDVGTPLGAAALGVLASIGCANPVVRRRPRVAILATGDELLAVHEELVPGRIRSSNDRTLAGQVREAGGVPIELGLVGDDREELRAGIERARDADVLVTSGGVSVGDRDEVQDVLAEAGFEKILWRIRSSPGKPLLFGRLGSLLVFGLPGNPVSSMVAFENFVRPTLRRLQGDASPERPRIRARVAGQLKGPKDRRHFARVRCTIELDGPVVREVGPHGSGNLRSMLNANALAIVPEGIARLDEGATVEVVRLD